MSSFDEYEVLLKAGVKFQEKKSIQKKYYMNLSDVKPTTVMNKSYYVVQYI